MGFDYNRKKDGHSDDSMWTSYSDLFLGLSIIFLLLYVSASLKQGTDGIRQHMEYKRLVRETEDLKQQIKVYEALKQDYLKKQASESEQANYEELMAHLDLLQDEANEEKQKLQAQALENEKKERALNKYQQMIRNIINTNLLAKARIKSRDTMIDTNEEIITEKSQEIDQLEDVVSEKTAEIKKGEERIQNLSSQLNSKMNALNQAYKAQKISKKKFQEQQAALKKETEKKIAALREKNAIVKQELDQASRDLHATSQKLAETEGTLAQVGAEKDQLANELQAATARHGAEVSKLRGEFEAQQARARAAFENRLAKEKLSGAQKAAREAQFKAEAERKAKELEGRIADLGKQFAETKGELAKAQENLNARKNLAQQIMNNFKAAGVGAEVDQNTGDVLLSFGDQYFDTGKAALKPQMRKILEQAIPAYSESLFKDQKIANKIQSVEIVGFASPTYKGRYVNPQSLSPEDRKAVNVNLDLSYARARSIFNHVFDKDKMTFKHQKQLLPLVKVTGRSFFGSDVRDPASTGDGSAEQFCKVNDCAKLQKVIIKFTLKD